MFSYLAAIVLALVVAYATGGFWVRLKPINVQATVQYTQDALLIFEVGFAQSAVTLTRQPSQPGPWLPGTAKRTGAGLEYVRIVELCVLRQLCSGERPGALDWCTLRGRDDLRETTGFLRYMSSGPRSGRIVHAWCERCVVIWFTGVFRGPEQRWQTRHN